MNRRRSLNETYRKTATGNPVVVRSAARRYPRISFPGFTTQDGTPSPENPVDIVNAESPVQVQISDGGENIQTVTITSDRPITKWDKLVKQNGVWGWLYYGKKVILNGGERWATGGGATEDYNVYYLSSSDYNAFVGNAESFSNKFRYDSGAGVNTQKQSSYGLFFCVDNNIATTVDEWKEWLKANNTEYLYKLAEPEFIHLTGEEQDMLNALHSNNPTTVVQNSINTDVTLTYKTKRSLEVTT